MCQIFTVYIYIYIYMCVCVCVCVFSFNFHNNPKRQVPFILSYQKGNWGTKRISNFSKVTQLTAASWKCKDNNKPQ